MLEKIDWSTREIKARLCFSVIKHNINLTKVYARVVQSFVSVRHDRASDPRMLTDKELDSVTAPFKSLESATIKQKMQELE